MKIVFVVNNKDNRLDKVLPELTRFFEKTFGNQVELVATERRKHAIELARNAAEDNCDYIIAVGGDGTLHEVINGVMQANNTTSDHPAVGLLPYGSANDFARTAHISQSFEELNNLIQTNSALKIDLGKIKFLQTGEVRYFINIAGVGLGAEIAQNMSRSATVIGSGFNYFSHIIRGFLRYDKKSVKCAADTWQWNGKLLQMAVANGRYFGNAICIAPDARLSDGQFQLAIFGDLSVWDYLKNLGNLKKGLKITHPEVSYHNANEVSLECKDTCGIEADGEYVGLCPANLSVVPNAIRFLMPASL